MSRCLRSLPLVIPKLIIAVGFKQLNFKVFVICFYALKTVFPL